MATNKSVYRTVQVWACDLTVGDDLVDKEQQVIGRIDDMPEVDWERGTVTASVYRGPSDTQLKVWGIHAKVRVEFSRRTE